MIAHTDKNTRLPLCGIMLDAARQTERYEYYQQLIPDLAYWGYNTILLHLMDDEGCAIQFDSPTVLLTPGALTAAQWKKIVELASAHGLTVIPEIECLGHTGYITRLPEYADLREPPGSNGLYWSINPLHPRTLEIISELLRQLAQIFPATYLHIGMDEADIGGSELCRKALADTPVWRLFGNYVLHIHDAAQTLGRQCMMWGDHVLKHRELRDMLPKDMVICDWLYGTGHRLDYESTMIYFLEAGFQAIACPSGCWYGTLFAPNYDNFANIREFHDVCLRLQNPNILGMISTLWEPYRYLPEMSHAIMAYAARISAERVISTETFLLEYVKQRFRVEGAAQKHIGAGMTLLQMGRKREMLELTLLAPLSEKIRNLEPAIRKFHHLCSTAAIEFHQALPSVHTHRDEYEQWLFTAEFMRDVAALQLAEIGLDSADLKGRTELYHRFRDACLKYRDYTAMQAEEPAQGQIGRYWKGTDNPVELLRNWAEIPKKN